MTSAEISITRKLQLTYIDARSLINEARITLGIIGYLNDDQRALVEEEAIKIFHSKPRQERQRLQKTKSDFDEFKTARKALEGKTVGADTSSNRDSLSSLSNHKPRIARPQLRRQKSDNGMYKLSRNQETTKTKRSKGSKSHDTLAHSNHSTSTAPADVTESSWAPSEEGETSVDTPVLVVKQKQVDKESCKSSSPPPISLVSSLMMFHRQWVLISLPHQCDYFFLITNKSAGFCILIPR